MEEGEREAAGWRLLTAAVERGDASALEKLLAATPDALHTLVRAGADSDTRTLRRCIHSRREREREGERKVVPARKKAFCSLSVSLCFHCC